MAALADALVRLSRALHGRLCLKRPQYRPAVGVDRPRRVDRAQVVAMRLLSEGCVPDHDDAAPHRWITDFERLTGGRTIGEEALIVAPGPCRCRARRANAQRSY